jgi:capsular polysaccharide biosynthesis protein
VRPPVDVPRGRDYLRILARSWIVVIGATILSALAVVLVNRYAQDPVYVASTRLFAAVPGDAQTHAAYEGNRGGTVRIETYAQLATSTIVVQRTIDELGLSEPADELAKRISVTSVPGTLSQFSYPLSVVMNVDVSGGDPTGTVDIANALARNLVATTQELEWDDTEPGPALVLVDEAKSVTTSRRSWLYDAGIGGGVGLVLSLLAVLATGVRRDTVLDREQLAYVTEQWTAGERGDGSS